MGKPIYLAGAGGHVRVVLDAIALQPSELEAAGLSDSDPTKHGQTLDGVPIVGDDAAMAVAGQGQGFIAAIGNNKIRRKIFEGLRDAGMVPTNVIHPRAVVSPRATLGVGNFLAAGAIVNVGAVVGDNCILNTGCSVDHDCRIGSHVHIAPGAHLAGNVTVGDGAQVSVGASVIPGVTIGAGAMVGAGAVVIRDVPAGATVVGVPAKQRE